MAFTELEAGLAQIPGIERVRVVGEDNPTEIHVVASPERPAKQVVRDVQSLAQASFGMAIDHRIVSVVQLDHTSRVGTRTRPTLSNVLVSSGQGAGRIEIQLQWPDGQVSSGDSISEDSRDARAHATAQAVLQALLPALWANKAEAILEDVSSYPTESPESVVVRIRWKEKDDENVLVGAAMIHGDVVNATARAVLAAVNRKVSHSV